jgi:hypothetical protein
MRNVLLSLAALGCLAVRASAGKIPEGMTRFNERCPAPKECAAFEKASETCRASRAEKACAPFIDKMAVLSADYDCQRSFDKEYIVPALWLCAEFTRLQAISLLSQLEFPRARRYYAGGDFRRVLDGETAEAHLMRSFELERALKAKPKKK